MPVPPLLWGLVLGIEPRAVMSLTSALPLSDISSPILTAFNNKLSLRLFPPAKHLSISLLLVLAAGEVRGNFVGVDSPLP